MVKQGIQYSITAAYDKPLADRLIKWVPTNERILHAMFRPESIVLNVAVSYGSMKGCWYGRGWQLFDESDNK